MQNDTLVGLLRLYSLPTLFSSQAKEGFLAQGLQPWGSDKKCRAGAVSFLAWSLLGTLVNVAQQQRISDDSGWLLPVPLTPFFTIGVFFRIAGIDILYYPTRLNSSISPRSRGSLLT